MPPLSKKEKREADKRADAEASTLARDFVMARLAAARVCMQSSLDAIDEALALFVETDEDRKGNDRVELIDTAIEQAGMATRALECAQEDVDRIDPQECEPWDEDSDDEGEE